MRKYCLFKLEMKKLSLEAIFNVSIYSAKSQKYLKKTPFISIKKNSFLQTTFTAGSYVLDTVLEIIHLVEVTWLIIDRDKTQSPFSFPYFHA